jgi:hypothetical protein
MKGRILKIKTGYNPNSSSVGVDMVAFLTGGAAVTVLFNAIAAILSAAKARKLTPQPVQKEEALELAGTGSGGDRG